MSIKSKKNTKEIQDVSENVEESNLNLDASETESDSDIDSDSDPDSNSAIEPQIKSKSEQIKEKIIKKYDEIRGKQLYVRFPQKLPLDDSEFQTKAKSLSPLIIRAHKPRQRHARFCLVDFETSDDRNKALKSIKSLSTNDENFKGVVVSLPKTESEDFIKEIIERKQKSIENKKAKALMKRATKQTQRDKNFTSSIVISNLPKTSSTAELRALFTNAVDIQIKPRRGKYNDTSFATITLPTTQEARTAVKKEYTLNGTKLIVRFNIEHKRQLNKKNKNKNKKQKTKA